jgi:hypothetical protein
MIRDHRRPLSALLALLLAAALAGCFSAAQTAEKLNTARLSVERAKDRNANIYAKEDFELCVRHVSKGEQAFWSGYNHRGFDYGRMAIADCDVSVERSRLGAYEANQSRLEEEIESLKKELSPYFSKEEITRELTITKEKASQ